MSNLTSLGILLSRGGSSADEGGTKSMDGGNGSSVGLVALYCFKHTFLDQIPLSGAGSTIKIIYSFSESMSKLVEVSYSLVLREMICQPIPFTILFFFLGTTMIHCPPSTRSGCTHIISPLGAETGTKPWVCGGCGPILTLCVIISGTMTHFGILNFGNFRPN